MRCNQYFTLVQKTKDYNEFDEVIKAIDISVECNDLGKLVLEYHRYGIEHTKLTKMDDLKSKEVHKESIGTKEFSLLQHLRLVHL